MAVLILDEKWPVLLIKIFFWSEQKAIGYHATDLASLPRDTFQEKDLALERPFCIFAFQSTIQKLFSKLKVWLHEKLEPELQLLILHPSLAPKYTSLAGIAKL